ncbi:hypothetical protein [Paenarthrobacter ureafaciens]|uniref:hypothetical protein n=1 Tax=Paenarthrobacter ureafaciens TaxID=37931 RepID=UPI002DC02E7D|nr:hypothetical protein [Paenarthrobacter ureafaciens]MEC3850815.1 hypothetical protein [Paenarthrobacter ureafaciens]
MTLIRGSRPRITATLVAVVLAVAVSGVALAWPQGSQVLSNQAEQPNPAPEATKPSPTPSPTVKTPQLPPYPIGGYFVSASSSLSRNSQKLMEMKAAGADTAITFGSSLRPVTLPSIPRDCLINGENCAKAVSDKINVNRYFLYPDHSAWSKKAVGCPRDRQVVSKGKKFTVLVIPTQGSGCNSSNGQYDVVVAGGGSSGGPDATGSLAAAATKLGMKLYAGLPAPVKRSDLPYLPDVSYTGTLTAFTERFLQYHASENNVAGLAGFYHHTEMPVTGSRAFDSVLDVYRMQNQAIHKILPTRAAIVSPYLDARVNAASISLDQAGEGARRIAQTASGLVLNIAIQDGMGTGKGGAFLENEAGSSVDRYAASIVGKGTWGAKYVAPVRDYFRAAAQGISGTGAVLWANLEGMAPATASNPCGDNLRGQSTKERIQRQLQQLSQATKIVSFMWDSYYTCAGKGTPLKTQMESGLGTPIITEATFEPSAGLVRIYGFNVVGGTTEVKWSTASGKQLTKKLAASGENTAYGANNGMHPKLEMMVVKVGQTTLAKDAPYSVTVTNKWKTSSRSFSSKSLYSAAG